MNSNPWVKCSQMLPQDKQLVETKIDDKDGPRSEQRLFRCGSLWFVSGGMRYVYYRPTHWRAIA